MVGEDGESHRHRVPFLHQIAHEDEVAERLRHLLSAQAHHPLVQPVPHEGLAGRRLGLRGLALVVGEDEVCAAAVQVDGRAQLA